VKYAGNWMPPQRDALTYRIQRRWLRSGLVRAAVTVNGRWPDQPSWVHTFDNPTLTDAELARGRVAAESKEAGPPWRVVFSGRLEREKGADIAVDTVLELLRRGLDVSLDLIGDGPLRPWVEDRIEASGGAVRLHGWMRRGELEDLLSRGHVFVLPTRSEGFPKVVAEAMAFGCVPVTAPVSSIGQTLGETGGAVLVRPDGSWVEAVSGVLDGSWQGLLRQGLGSVDRFSYSTYLERVRSMAEVDWGRLL
ncbi:MAG TPA: glycosyltransferase family 4 protein, partial [Microthrixaceae bacterium]|nr:glycosyltransferase family 4 protein [Microthrixaceae bacterium]